LSPVYNSQMHLHREHRSANAIRVSRAYQRRRAGLAVLPIEVDAVALADALIEARLIDPNMVDDRTALAKATARLLEIFCKEKTK
jgi:hypothetical protein